MAKRLFALIFISLLAGHEVYADQKVDASVRPPTQIRKLESNEKISPDELYALLLKKEPLLLVDVRGKKSYREAHIPGAQLPLTKEFYDKQEMYELGITPDKPDPNAALMVSTRSIPKGKPFVAYCSRNCKASTYFLMQMKDLGFTDVRVMEEGIEGWREKGYPIASKK